MDFVANYTIEATNRLQAKNSINTKPVSNKKRNKFETNVHYVHLGLDELGPVSCRVSVAPENALTLSSVDVLGVNMSG